MIPSGSSLLALTLLLFWLLLRLLLPRLLLLSLRLDLVEALVVAFPILNPTKKVLMQQPKPAKYTIEDIS